MPTAHRSSWRAYLPQLGVLVVALGVILVVRALTDDDGGPSSSSAATATTATTRPVDDRRTTTTASTSTPDLQGALLRLDELPGGWRQGSSDGETAALCDDRDPMSEIPPDGLSQTVFSRDTAGLVLSNVVADFGSDARAASLLDSLRDTIEDCGTFDTDDGAFELDEVRAPDLGDGVDEVVAAVLVGGTSVGEVEGRLLYVRVGDRVTALALVGSDEVDADLLEEAAVTVAGRL